jgi:hypothetical protein
MSLVRSRFLSPIAIGASIACLGLALAGAADVTPPASDTPAPPAKVKAKKPMKMDQPMAGEMKKEGMTKGDMKKAADKKQRDMDDAMRKDEQAMKKGGS